MSYEMHPIRKMFEQYTHWKNTKLDPDDYPTREDYMNVAHGIEIELDAIEQQLKANGYKTVFKHLDDNGVYHYDLEQI